MHYDEYNDETLVMLTLAGEQNAYEALVEKYQRAVINSALAVTKSGFMAEDAAQDAFVTAWIKLNTLREHSKFGGWVCRIARNCALNTLTRYRSFLPIESVDNLEIASDTEQCPEMLYVLSEDKKELDDTIDRLPKKIKQIITMHYFEGLSIAEIADRMRISEGTVKSQLHDGRKRMRKELCAMNEKWNDTLVQKVMKKVEELKLWQLKNNKDGFEVIYKDVLRDIEELPECTDKNHALADVLMRGWWWLPGTKNEALFDRIRSAAEEGKNDDVMSFIVSREDSKVSEEARLEFIRDKQIPRLETLGFTKALAHEWFWLARAYYRAGDMENGDLAYAKVKSILDGSEIYYVLSDVSKKLDKTVASYKEKNKRNYRLYAGAVECRYVGGEARFWAFQTVAAGWHGRFDNLSDIFRTSSLCDGKFYDETLKLGESYEGSDGSKLTFVSDRERVETPCGIFDDCQLWRTEHYEQYSGRSVYNIYYKDGVGIVKHSHKYYGITDTMLLKNYSVKGGSGILPLAKNNCWEYVLDFPSDCTVFEANIKIDYVDNDRVLASTFSNLERLKYDENSWADMILKIRYDYCDDKDVLQDVYYPMERVTALAKTPMEKVHTKAAVSTAKRILETDAVFNPNRTQSGHWNFFHKNHTHYEKGCVSYEHNSNWSFE